jgi:hypothetical protein
MSLSHALIFAGGAHMAVGVLIITSTLWLGLASIAIGVGYLLVAESLDD